MRKVAIVGFGFMGKTHYGAWKRCPGAKVVAVCDLNLAQLTAKVVGNIKGVADNAVLPESVKVWESFEAMLATGGFDIVDITLPTPLHRRMSILALQAGFHVLCEKPMALELADCDRMIAAARTAKRQLLVAHCVRFFPENVYVRELVKSEKYGKVIAADFSRFIAPPKWSLKGSDWFLDEKRSGGVLLDAHIHDLDYILGTFGKPKGLTCVAHRSPAGLIDHTSTTYRYDGPVITSDSSFAVASSFVWEASGRIFFERATVCFGPLFKSPLTVYPEGGKPFSPKLAKRSGYEEEVRYFLGLVEGRKQERVLTAEDARESVRLALAERRSALSGRPVVLQS